VDAEDIRELFEPVGRVTLRRMLGGQGVYLDGLIFALEADGAVFMKTDEVNRPRFEALGARPFTYLKQEKEAVLTSYWSLPDAAFDDVTILQELTHTSLAAAGRAALRKTSPPRRRVTAASGSARRGASRPAG
jgi:DNA transformation protein and related proteins